MFLKTVTAVHRVCLIQVCFLFHAQRLSVISGVCKKRMKLCYCDTDSIDTTFSMLDDIVSEKLEAGAKPYIPPHLRRSIHGKRKLINTDYRSLKCLVNLSKIIIPLTVCFLHVN